jgi:two-component system LytT family response regulator
MEENKTKTSDYNNIKTIVIKTLRYYLRIPIEEIIYCQADGSYSEINLINGEKIIVSKSLRVIEELLKDDNFVRCHNSFLVNIAKVEKFSSFSRTLSISGHIIPVSRRNCHKIRKELRGSKYQL